MKPRICQSCGERAVVQTGRGTTTYGGRTTPSVQLLNVPQYQCGTCGTVTYGIPNVDGLHHVLRGVLATARARLAPSELRLLRKLVGWSVEDVARQFGVEPSRVEAWETLPGALTVVEEMKVRAGLMFAGPIDDYQDHDLRVLMAEMSAVELEDELPEEPSDECPRRFEFQDPSWKPADCAEALVHP